MREKKLYLSVMIGCFVFLTLNITVVSNCIFRGFNLSNIIIDVSALEAESEILDVNPEPISEEWLRKQSEPVVATYEEIVETNDSIHIMPSITFKNNAGVIVNTDVIEFDKDVLCLHHTKKPDWDYKNRIQDIYIVWHFLVDEMGVSPMNASAMCGSVYFEGSFGEEQSTGKFLKSIDDARANLGSGKRGYGLAQWTFGKRQKVLLDYYELANEMFPDNWELAIKVAECCMLYEELKAYSIFSDIHVDTTVEDACGRVCLKYEAYENSNTEWKRTNGEYKLVSNNGTGNMRLKFAHAIYEYFMNEE